MENKCLLIIIVLLTFYILHLNLRLKNVEGMANTDDSSIKEKIEEGIKTHYKADVQSIRNLAEISAKLQAGNLEIPGDLKIKGKLTVEKDSTFNNVDVKNTSKLNNVNMNNLTVYQDSLVQGTTTIHTLNGGKYTGGGGWRDIEVKEKGKGLRFILGNKKFGFHPNENGIHYQVNNDYKQMPIYQGAKMLGNLNTNNLEVNDYIGCKRLDVRNPNKNITIPIPFGRPRTINVGGTTHFNYNNTGQFYLRGIRKQLN